MKHFRKQLHILLPWLLLTASLIFLSFVWRSSGIDSVSFDTDLARDLKEISTIQLGTVVWLGPWLGPGLHASSAYYYLFYPAIALSGGKVASMVWFNLVLGLLAVGYFGLYAVKKHRFVGVIGVLALSLSPVITENILHPGNGFSYIYFVLISITALWFDSSFILACFAAGCAVALHPAAGILPFFLLIRWWNRGHTWKDAVLGGVAATLPLAPLIAFEAITKGYIIRSFLSKPSSNGIFIQFGLENARQIGSLIGFSLLPLVICMGIASFQMKQTKIKFILAWLYTTLALFGFVLFFQNVLWRYLFAYAVLAIFTIVVMFMRQKVTTLVLVGIAVLFLARSPLLHPPQKATRTIAQVEATADYLKEKHLLSYDKKIAVVAALSADTQVPQADDYRFLLRNRGYTVVDTTENQTADQLLYVLEVPDFNWEQWSTWEIEQFGSKKLVATDTFDHKIRFAVFERK